MSIDIRAFAWAAGFTAAVLFLICATAVAVAPEPTASFFGFLFHADLSSIVRRITVGQFVGGVLAWTAGTALTFARGAWFCDRMTLAGRTAA